MRRRFAAALAVLVAASACSPGSEPPAERNEQEVRTGPAPRSAVANVAEAAAPVQTEIAAENVAGAGERRCGWLSNPTPGNWWLDDRDGQWVLATQGGEPVAGMEDMPDMSTAGWVETNGHYGYGCACMTIAYDPASRRVTRVANAKPKPLKQCRADKGLPKP